ncbi:MAG: MTAP family purine nucleoside phosphorylase, partial [Anaerolineales bacterium]
MAVIGGSGLYSISDLGDVQEHDLDTPFGKPSAPIVVGTLEGQKVAFLARHGDGHWLSPSEVNYRANIYALKSLGVRKIISISACGSLREDYAPGDIVIPDGLFDFTRDRKRTFFEDHCVVHISIPNPFCEQLSGKLYQAVNKTGTSVHKSGIFITIEGPRFSTIAESN